MKILNLNVYFYPESYGGATIVAERLSHGLIEIGHNVTNICLGTVAQSGLDFDVVESHFGTVIRLNHIEMSSRTRFQNPPASTLIRDIIEVVQPEHIFLHAPQNLGLLELASDRSLPGRITVVAHDFFWRCLQGFRVLPSGKTCSRQVSGENCRECSFFPGLAGPIQNALASFLMDCKAVVFPSAFIADEYSKLFGMKLDNAFVIGNPDFAENLFGDNLYATEQDSDVTSLGYFGGPGYTKGWDVITRLARDLPNLIGNQTRLYLFDAGTLVGRPWYAGVRIPAGAEVRPGFHWSAAASIYSELDIALVPSRVRESFGLVPREVLSTGGSAVIFPSGALRELAGYDGIFVADDGSFGEAVRDAARKSTIPRMHYENLTSRGYAQKMLETI